MRKIAFLFAVLGAGCFTMVNEHSAEVLQPGSVEFMAGAVLDGRGTVLPAFDAHLGLLPRTQAGARWDTLSFALDARFHLIEASDYGFDVCLEAGMGSAIVLAPFWYVGVGVSKKYERAAPYLHLRYMEAEIDVDKTECFVWDMYAYAVDGLNTVVQLFVGAEVEVGNGVLFVPEIVIIPTLMDDQKMYVAYNLGLRIRLGGAEPPAPVPADEVAPVSPSE